VCGAQGGIFRVNTFFSIPQFVLFISPKTYHSWPIVPASGDNEDVDGM
jgi:hypothetical protein